MHKSNFHNQLDTFNRKEEKYHVIPLIQALLKTGRSSFVQFM